MDYPDDYVDETAIASYLTYLDELPVINANQLQKDQVKKQEQLDQFKRQLTNVIHDDIQKHGAQNSILRVDTFEQGGNELTEAYKRDLMHQASIELEKYEAKINKAKVAQSDCFGISRRFCRICGSQCPGYEASDSNFGNSVNEMRGEFPTFCKICQCPSFFHNLEGASEKQDTVYSAQSDQGALVVEFPDEFASLLKTNNLRSQDVNFNCVLAVFEQTSDNIMKELQELMKSEGIEIINHVTRELTPEEMFFLKARITDIRAKKLAKEAGNFFQNVNSHNDLKLNGNLDELMLNMMSQNNPYNLGELANKTQKSIGQLTMTNQTNPVAITNNTVYLNTQNALSAIREEADEQSEDDINHRDLGQTGTVSFFRPPENTLNALLAEQQKIMAFKPTKSSETKSNYKFKQLKEQKGGNKARVNEKINDTEQLRHMANFIQDDDQMRSMFGQEYVIMVFNSSTYQNMYAKVQALVAGQVKMIYQSNTKIQAFEDCITFMPQLFRLSKSILVSENVTTFHDQMSRFGAGAGFAKSERKDFVEVKPTSLPTEEQFRNKREVNHYNEGHGSGLVQKATLKKFMTSLKDSMEVSRRMTNQTSKDDRVSVRVARHVVQKYTRKDEKLKDLNFKMMYNYGMIIDFLNYSGMSVQMTIQSGDMAKPPHPTGIRGGLHSLVSFNLMSSQPCNIFAIAKVGVPNLIMPNTLDVKFSNYENYDSYVEISDLFFPENSKSQISVAILRPQMIKSGLNHLLCQILKANEFTILKRIVRPLTKAEVGYLLHAEKIHDNNHALYFDLMMDGPVEILALSKMGAISDLKTLFNGSNPFGRRRTNQSNEGQDIRANVDSTNAMFEIAPFTSFNEMIDLQDFIIRNSKIAKYQKFLEPTAYKEKDQKNDFVASKKAQILTQITLFQRFFNLAGFCSDSEATAAKDLSIFTPKLAQLEEVVLILNPLYNPIIDHTMELLVRLGYTFIQQQSVELTLAKSQQLFSKKLSHHTDHEKEIFYNLFEETPVTVFHLSKLAGKKELKRIYQACGLQMNNTLVHEQFGLPLKPERMPYLFFLLDEESTFEAGLELIYNPHLLAYQGKDFLKKFSNQEIYSILQTNCLVSVGDTIKVMQYDTKTGILHDKNYYKDVKDSFTSLNVLQTHEGSGLEPQFFPQFNSFGHFQPYQSFKIETHCSGVYQIRFRNLQIWDKPDTIKPIFASLLLYYQEVNKVSYNICPTFYKYKIAKNKKQQIKRAVEVEESMGDTFIEMMGKLHRTQAQIQAQSKGDGQFESIPAYVYSKLLSDMCKTLQTIETPPSLKGAGKIIYDAGTKCLRGEFETPANFYDFDIKRYRGYLEKFRIGWRHFLGVLEIDLIEEKIGQILGSLTFKHTRDPNFLKLAPERITSQNLRVAEKIHILDPTSLDLNNNEKFFKHLKDQVLDPNREKEIYDKVDSVLQTIKLLSLQPVTKQKKKPFDAYMSYKEDVSIAEKIQDDDKHIKTIKNHLEQQEKLQQELMVHRNVAISGFQDGICVKPKHHLIANLLWIFDFELRKLNRRKELFQTSRNTDLDRVSKEYDDVLNTLHEQMVKTYLGDEPWAFDVIASMQGEVVKETDFDLNMRIKRAEEQRIKEMISQEAEWENRKKRATMTIEELIQKEIHEKVDIERKREKDQLVKDLHTKSGDPMGDAFKLKLEQSGMMLGPHASKIAEEDVIKYRAIQQSKNRPGTYMGQENISFVMMEYFLFGMAEANLLIEELYTMEKIQTKWSEVIERLESLMHEQETIRQNATGQARVEHAQNFESLKLKKQEFSLMYEDLLKQINFLQSQLVMVFRELAMCNFQVPKNYFEEWHRIQLQRKQGEKFKIDLKTFWKPLELPGEAKVMRNTDNSTWAKIVGGRKMVLPKDETLTQRTQRGDSSFREKMEGIPFGRFLSKAQRDLILYCPEHQLDKKDCETCEACKKKFEKLIPTGKVDKQLRTPEDVAKPDALNFDKFWSKSQLEQAWEYAQVSQKIKEKNAKEKYQPSSLKLERE